MLSREKLRTMIRNVIRNTYRGNKKLRGMYSWSIVGVVSCPGRTGLCESLCYGKKMRARRRNVHEAYVRNLALTRQRWFREAWSLALGDIADTVGQYILRLHVDGDMYDRRYTEALLSGLADNHRYVYPFAFTRSWRRRWFKGAVMRTWGNWPEWLLCSTDAETGGLPDSIRGLGAREAYMSEHSVRDMVRDPNLARDDVPLCLEHLTHGRIGCDACGRCIGVRVNGQQKLVQISRAALKRGVTFGRH